MMWRRPSWAIILCSITLVIHVGEAGLFDPDNDPKGLLLFAPEGSDYEITCGLVEQLNSSCWMVWTFEKEVTNKWSGDICYGNSTANGCYPEWIAKYYVVFNNARRTFLNIKILKVTRNDTGYYNCSVYCSGSILATSQATLALMEKYTCQASKITFAAKFQIAYFIQYYLSMPFLDWIDVRVTVDGQFSYLISYRRDSKSGTITSTDDKNLTAGHHEVLFTAGYSGFKRLPLCLINVYVCRASVSSGYVHQ